jgi:hypothetical protein
VPAQPAPLGLARGPEKISARRASAARGWLRAPTRWRKLAGRVATARAVASANPVRWRLIGIADC